MQRGAALSATAGLCAVVGAYFGVLDYLLNLGLQTLLSLSK